VQSLISRLRHGATVLELGHEGTVVGLTGADSEHKTSSGKADPNSRLLVQFKFGFDWLLMPHQVCHQSNFQSVTAAGLAGGFKWGDKVQSLIVKLHPSGAKRGLGLGEEGTVIGPGAANGKLAIRFGEDAGEWSLWPNAICKTEAYSTTMAARLPGGFRRGDRVKSKALKVVSGGDSESPTDLKDGQEGTVVGPGHLAGRLLVCFDGNLTAWSVDPTALTPE
jgi:hypothetical protein